MKAAVSSRSRHCFDETQRNLSKSQTWTERQRHLAASRWVHVVRLENRSDAANTAAKTEFARRRHRWMSTVRRRNPAQPPHNPKLGPSASVGGDGHRAWYARLRAASGPRHAQRGRLHGDDGGLDARGALGLLPLAALTLVIRPGVLRRAGADALPRLRLRRVPRAHVIYALWRRAASARGRRPLQPRAPPGGPSPYP
eukprot:scaffold54579_cov43-Phaeocystis_antarctica.AAC.3